MPRPNRVHVEGGVYHVYNRVGRGERVFEASEIAGEFVRLLSDVVNRDELTVFAWCVMPSHFHLALRMGVVSLDRPMRSLQQRVTRGVNQRRQVYGPLWQGRYRAKLVNDQRYLDQLLIYIHLNPVTAGIVDDPARYRWSGHGELLGTRRNPIVDTDEVLRLFGSSRRSARAAYVRQLKGALEERWIGEDPGHLPWWRLGRPPEGEDEDPEAAIRARRAQEEAGPEWRPRTDAETFVTAGARHLGIGQGELQSRSRGKRLVRARELLVTLGAERYGLRVNDLARAIRKSPQGVTLALARGSRRRVSDAGFRRDLDGIDKVLAEVLVGQGATI